MSILGLIAVLVLVFNLFVVLTSVPPFFMVAIFQDSSFKRSEKVRAAFGRAFGSGIS